MRQKLEEFLSDPTDATKELARKLYWAVTSTCPMTQEQRSSTFAWAANLADKLTKRIIESPPPAARSLAGGKAVAMEQKKRYAALAGGGAAGSLDQSRRIAPSSGLRGPLPPPSGLRGPLRKGEPRIPTAAEMRVFKDQQARLKAAAIQYMRDGAIKLGVT